jgi:hypothetical protein
MVVAAVVGGLVAGPPEPPNPVDLVPHSAPAPLTAGEWPLYGRDVANSRDGGSAGPSPMQVLGLRPVWSVKSTGAVLVKLPLGAPSYGGVSVAGGYVFAAVGTQGESGYVVGYRAA